jgi:hypothetical protein
MQYELEQAHHSRRAQAAERERLAAEAERLAVVQQPGLARPVFSRLVQVIATRLHRDVARRAQTTT